MYCALHYDFFSFFFFSAWEQTNNKTKQKTNKQIKQKTKKKGKKDKKKRKKCCKCVMQSQLWSSHFSTYPLLHHLFPGDEENVDKNSIYLQADSTAQACISGEEDNTDPSTVTSMSVQVSAAASPQGDSDISSNVTVKEWWERQWQPSMKLKELAAQSSCTHSRKPKLNTTWMGDLRARFCASSEIFLESNSVQTL